ncbi:MAG: succinate dehydrogenase assembly factor 2 [Woeseiaceae bacterium]
MSQLHWQCRRGMRELDELLLGYLDGRYATADNTEKAAFRSLLQLSDPELIGYLLQQRTSPPELAVVIKNILLRTGP